MKKLQYSTMMFLSFLTLAIGVIGNGRRAISLETPTPSLRRITVAEATGKTGSTPTLYLVPGYGLNISFIPTGEIIEKVWLDNPQFITLDVDGCLAGLSRQACPQPGATVVHLRRIEELDIPGLPRTNSTLLTVITTSRTGRRVYTFRLSKGSGMPQYHTVEVIVSAEVALARQTSFVSLTSSGGDWQTIENGVRVAVERRLLRQGSPLWYRIENFLQRLKSGSSTIEAANLSGISVELVGKLQELGARQQPINNSSPSLPQS